LISLAFDRLSIAFGHLATADEEIGLSVGRLERTIEVAPFRWWWRRPFFFIVVLAVVVVVATSVITPIISTIITLVITAIILAVVMLVIAVIAMIVVAAVVAAISTPIPIVIVTVTVVEALVTVMVVVVAALGLFRGRQDPKGTLQLLALPHGVFSVAVELALVDHDHVKVTFEESG
jgi:hypothetical protein